MLDPLSTALMLAADDNPVTTGGTQVSGLTVAIALITTVGTIIGALIAARRQNNAGPTTVTPPVIAQAATTTVDVTLETYERILGAPLRAELSQVRADYDRDRQKFIAQDIEINQLREDKHDLQVRYDDLQSRYNTMMVQNRNAL